MTKLAQYFTGIAAKRLSAVETDPETSNQHEFNGVTQMVGLFGKKRINLPCKYLYLGNDEEESVSADGTLTWYDAREKHPTRSEYRLYFQTNAVTGLALEGDLLVLGRRSDETVLALIVRNGSTFERQIMWLFDIAADNYTFKVTSIEGEKNKEIGFAERMVLETLGILTEESQPNWLDTIVRLFGLQFPTTKIFSTFARETLPDVLPTEDPDKTLLAWLNREELLFRTLERHLVQERIQKGFENVDDFVMFSLSVHNRRKARVGFALENHLAYLFDANGIDYSRGATTENNAKPDFIFPAIAFYHNPDFPSEQLSMLGVKSTCKDRWRQVLSEAQRINRKHLLTLEPGISRNQTDEMRGHHLQLVLPKEIHSTYMPDQQGWLLSLAEFMDLVKERQRS
jgi:hypothetical protein